MSLWLRMLFTIVQGVWRTVSVACGSVCPCGLPRLQACVWVARLSSSWRSWGDPELGARCALFEMLSAVRARQLFLFFPAPVGARARRAQGVMAEHQEDMEKEI